MVSKVDAAQHILDNIGVKIETYDEVSVLFACGVAVMMRDDVASCGDVDAFDEFECNL